MDRRAFLKNVAFSAIALRATATASYCQANSFAGVNVPAMHGQLLELVNTERAAAGLTSLKLDELGCAVAEKHAIEMAEYDFLSHWGLDGRKPYHRYSNAGGIEAIQENDGAINATLPISPEEIPSNIITMHKSMHDEMPPNDGHRKTILNPSHTHVGFGYAARGYCARLCELYVSRYVVIDPIRGTAPPRSKLVFSGRLLDTNHSVKAIDVFYEPLPSPPELPWLRIARPYGLPGEHDTLWPKLGTDWFYKDGSKGSIELRGRGRFQAPILLSRKQPGIYTIVLWIQRSSRDTPIPATQVCVRAE